MTQERRIVSFTIDEPFDVSLRMFRRALAREGLRVPCEVDTSARLKEELGIALRNSIVLYVDTPMLLLEATVLHAAGGLYVPEPVVLCSGEKECTVVVRSIKPLLDEGFPNSVREAILLLHERILKAIQSIGHREAAIQYAHTKHSVPA
ncbi:MAG: hypothetical protein ACRD7E_09465 [Bryobacteraceae bacterium]